MPINPNIDRTMAEVVDERISDVIAFTNYALQIISQTESEVVHIVDEKAGTMKHQFDHLLQAEPQIVEPVTETTLGQGAEVIDMMGKARRDVSAAASQPVNFEQLLIDAQREAA